MVKEKSFALNAHNHSQAGWVSRVPEQDRGRKVSGIHAVDYGHAHPRSKTRRLVNRRLILAEVRIVGQRAGYSGSFSKKRLLWTAAFQPHVACQHDRVIEGVGARFDPHRSAACSSDAADGRLDRAVIIAHDIRISEAHGYDRLSSCIGSAKPEHPPAPSRQGVEMSSREKLSRLYHSLCIEIS